MKTIYIAMVTHEYGATGFASDSKQGLDKKVADWCREYDSSLVNEGPDRFVIDAYFSEDGEGGKGFVNGEDLYEDTDEIESQETNS